MGIRGAEECVVCCDARGRACGVVGAYLLRGCVCGVLCLGCVIT